jgi:hypothetical protein
MSATYHHKREFLCLSCGRIRSADGPVPDGGTPGPQCCGEAMRLLGYEAATAAKQLDLARRAAWFRAGAHYAKRGGKRKWKPVMDARRCHGCHGGREL